MSDQNIKEVTDDRLIEIVDAMAGKSHMYPVEMMRRLKDSIEKLNDSVSHGGEMIMLQVGRLSDETLPAFEKHLQDAVEDVSAKITMLSGSVEDLNWTTTRYSKVLVGLTVAIAILTVIQIIVAVIR